MKKSILSLIAILLISFTAQSQVLSLNTGWNVQYSKQFPKGTHRLGYGPTNWADGGGYNEMKYHMGIVEDPRNGNVFLNFGSSDTMFINKYTNFNFNTATPIKYKIPKATAANDWSIIGDFSYDIYTNNVLDNGLNGMFEYHFALGDTVYRNQKRTDVAQSTYLNHPFSTNIQTYPFLSTYVAGVNSYYNSNSQYYTTAFNHHNPQLIKYQFNSAKNLLKLYANVNDIVNSLPALSTVSLTCNFGPNEIPARMTFQYMDENTMYVKYIKAYMSPTLGSQYYYDVKDIYVDTISVVGNQLVIGNYFKMSGLENYPTLSFEYSNIYCHNTEVYIMTSNSDSAGVYAPHYSNSINVFGTPVQFAVPYLFCFSTVPPIITDITTNKIEEQVTKLTTYPNPSNGDINVAFETKEKKTTINVFNIQGQLIHSETLETDLYNDIKLNLANLTKGIYIVRVGTKSTKIQIQ